MPCKASSDASRDFTATRTEPLSCRSDVPGMFDRIAPTYDPLNRILSFGLDISWRRKVARLLDSESDLSLVDLATGTGDLLAAILRRRPNVTAAVGLDLSENMLAICRKKMRRLRLAHRAELIRADAAATTFGPDTFDAATMAFGIRNTPDIPATLREIHRILKPGGLALILEFSLPRNPVIRAACLFYLRCFVPLIGRAISGDSRAYRYLDQSIEAFHTPAAFSSLMQQAGFRRVSARSLSFGLACIYAGYKAPQSPAADRESASPQNAP